MESFLIWLAIAIGCALALAAFLELKLEEPDDGKHFGGL